MWNSQGQQTRIHAVGKEGVVGLCEGHIFVNWLTRIASRDWIRGGLDASEEVLENLRHYCWGVCRL